MRQRRRNDVTSPLAVVFPKKEQPKYTAHDLQVSDAFMQKVVGELDPNGTGDLVARFVKINSEMRRANNKTLSDLRFKTADKFLWSQPFISATAFAGRGELCRLAQLHLPRAEDRSASTPGL